MFFIYLTIIIILFLNKILQMPKKHALMLTLEIK